MKNQSNTNKAAIVANTVLPPVKTLKSFIKLCEMISAIDRDKLKGIHTDEQYRIIENYKMD